MASPGFRWECEHSRRPENADRHTVRGKALDKIVPINGIAQKLASRIPINADPFVHDLPFV